jgi:hypothetical protein
VFSGENRHGFSAPLMQNLMDLIQEGNVGLIGGEELTLLRLQIFYYALFLIKATLSSSSWITGSWSRSTYPGAKKAVL